MQPDPIIAATRRWLESMVIGLNLCPFAQRVYRAEKIRYILSNATDPILLLADLEAELRFLTATPIDEVETTLLIHPGALVLFLDYNDFLADADRLIRRMNLDGVIQIASFHPHYQFAGTDPDDVENYTNRSPYPMLHLLREASIDRLDLSEEELAAIPERNIATLRRLGCAEILRRIRTPPPDEANA